MNVAIVTIYIKLNCSKFMALLKSIFTIYLKIRTGSDTEKTNFDVTSIKFSFIIPIFFDMKPNAMIKNTGATVLAVNKILSIVL